MRESNGKTEMWYVVDAKPGSSLLYGFEKEISREEFKRRIEDQSLLEVLHRQPVKAGDVLMIQAGTIHAICGGVLIAEIQQNSNTTYRVYDYGRLGTDGKPRALHVEKALDVVQIKRPAPLLNQSPQETPNGNLFRHLAACPYFVTDYYQIHSSLTLESMERSFVSLLFISGDGTLEWQDGTMEFHKGDSILVPAGLGRFTISGPAELLTTEVGEEN